VKAIDASIKMKPLKPSEVSQLNQWLQQAVPMTQQIASTAGSQHAPSLTTAQKDSIDNLRTAVTTYGTAVEGRTSIAKMSCVQMSTLKIALDLDDNPTDAQLLTEAEQTYTAFTRALNKEGGLEKIGEILAGDWCIGNCDRFSPPKFSRTGKVRGAGVTLGIYDAQGKAPTGKPRHQLNLIINLGNVILVGDDQLSMLDYMDPNSGFARALQRTANFDEVLKEWPMANLLNPTTRAQMAQLLADDLAYLLHPRNSGSVNSWKRNVGGRSAWKRIDAGIVSGIKKIMASMQSKKDRGKLPVSGQFLLSELKKAKL
jgi:hypothetical protein